ncbi:hypothetical protein BSL78_21498 [Apostichopus japonicus]|uniref:Uncharacterized protein n=1 Tax=Stichopus japonicus TaxID=307972 RepID=A0A2G8K0X0_STIJA|nr:hypothetical protein BSL78_21498 [Apostichopus japonicus]
MGRKLKNLLKRKNKGEKANKRKLTTHNIEVLFDTGTSGPYAPSIPTTSAASNADPKGNAPAAAANESVLPKTSGTSLSLQQRKNSTRPSSDKSDVIIKKLEEMTKTLSCELAEMTASNDLTRRPQPDQPSAQGDQLKTAMLQKSAFIKQEKGALDMPTCTSHVADKAVQYTQTDSAIQTFDGMDGASPSDKTLGGKQNNWNLEALLARCLGVMEQKSSMKDKEQLVKEIREALGRDEMTKSHVVLTPENINLQEWQKTAAKRPFARKGLVKMLRDEYQSQSLYTDTSDDDDADSFVSAVSSVSSLANISDNIHQMELLET